MKFGIGKLEDLDKILGGIIKAIEGSKHDGDASKNDDGTDRKIIASHKLSAAEMKTLKQLHQAAAVYNERAEEMRKLSDAIDKKRKVMWDGFTEKYKCHQGKIVDGVLNVYECDHEHDDEEEEDESPSIEDLLERLSR